MFFIFGASGRDESELRAVQWFRLAADQEDVDAQYNFGVAAIAINSTTHAPSPAHLKIRRFRMTESIHDAHG